MSRTHKKKGAQSGAMSFADSSRAASRRAMRVGPATEIAPAGAPLPGLPQGPTAHDDPAARLVRRGMDDVLALRATDDMTPEIAARHRPSGHAGELYDALLAARSLARVPLPGVLGNVGYLVRDDLRAANPPLNLTPQDVAAFCLLAGQEAPENIRAKTAKMIEHAEPHLPALRHCVTRADDFAQAARAASLGWHESILRTAFRQAIRTLNERRGGEKAGDGDQDDTAPADKSADFDLSQLPQASPRYARRQPRSTSADKNPTKGQSSAIERKLAAEPGLAPPPVSSTLAKGTYQIATTENDRVENACDLLSPRARSQSRVTLDRFIAQLPDSARRLPRLLQRKIQAQDKILWQFEQEEGVIDSARLAGLVADPLKNAIYKDMVRASARNTAVTLLIDNSGSMANHSKIHIAMACGELFGDALEKCGVKVEILGFTTNQRLSDDNQRKYSVVKSTARIDALRHIVYKRWDEPMRRARDSFGVPLDEHKTILKENCDGEALLWAHRRLLQIPAERRILLVVSDGQPCAWTNDSLLIRHLRDVIGGIERAGLAELLAIGIGHDVGRYYRNAVTINYPGDLGSAMMGKLADLFTPPSPAVLRKARLNAAALKR